MATNQIGNFIEVVDKRQATNAGATTIPLATPLEYTSMSAMDTRLAAISGYYTAAVIANMTRNDKIYAIRVADDPTGI